MFCSICQSKLLKDFTAFQHGVAVFSPKVVRAVPKAEGRFILLMRAVLSGFVRTNG